MSKKFKDYSGNKNSKQEEIKLIVSKIELGIKKFQESEFFKNYLKTMAKFHNYSWGNCMLITMQKRNATLVAGFNTWKSVGRHVKKGEKGIAILAPCIYKNKKHNEIEVIEHNEQENEINENKSKEDEVQRIGFKKVTVFDISQTEGKEIPSLTTELKGEAKDLEIVKATIAEITGYNIIYEDITGGAKGYCSYDDKCIAIKKGMSELQQMKTLLHEGAHAVLHFDRTRKNVDRNTAETEAESVAYTVCCKLGIDTGEYSFPYLASWASNQDLTELKSSLKNIQNTSMNFINKIEEKIKVAEKEIVDKSKNKEACL